MSMVWVSFGVEGNVSRSSVFQNPDPSKPGCPVLAACSGERGHSVTVQSCSIGEEQARALLATGMELCFDRSCTFQGRAREMLAVPE